MKKSIDNRLALLAALDTLVTRLSTVSLILSLHTSDLMRPGKLTLTTRRVPSWFFLVGFFLCNDCGNDGGDDVGGGGNGSGDGNGDGNGGGGGGVVIRLRLLRMMIKVDGVSVLLYVFLCLLLVLLCFVKEK